MTVYQQLTDNQLYSQFTGAIAAYAKAVTSFDDLRMVRAGDLCCFLAREAKHRGWAVKYHRSGRYTFKAPADVTAPILAAAKAAEKAAKQEASAVAETVAAMAEAERQSSEPVAQGVVTRATSLGIAAASDPGDQPKAKKASKGGTRRVKAVAVTGALGF